MKLTKENLGKIASRNGWALPDLALFALPEKVLQFGTGVLLRGLPDYVIDKANRQLIFNGRIVVVKSTSSGTSDDFDDQDGLYTVNVTGIDNGQPVSETIINSAISRVLSAATQWEQVLACAASPDMQIIISNTTEVGITLDPTDRLAGNPPRSFPGKLLAFLYRRWQAFDGSAEKGMVIVPTELITGNGDLLRQIVLELAGLHQLETGFIHWLSTSNYFCNSLVDRIVPGKPGVSDMEELQSQIGYTDALLIRCEPYRLWAIEARHPLIGTVLSFAAADEGVILAPDIEVYRELKLRLLNGTHTFCCGLALLCGFKTVREAMADPVFATFALELMMKEIIPALVDNGIDRQQAIAFASKVLDRFRNPSIDHQWLSITLQYSSKMKMRNLPIIASLLQQGAIPARMALGIAAMLMFLRSAKSSAGEFTGEAAGERFAIKDDQAAWFHDRWMTAKSKSGAVDNMMKDQEFWNFDFTSYPEFINAISGKLQQLSEEGAIAAIRQVTQTAKPAVLS